MRLTALFGAKPFAHRGLWSSGGAPENSLAAFDAACTAGYGIELDVRLSADGEAVVFHDAVLERMTAQAGLVEERTVDDLQALRLLGSDQTIPTLGQALSLIGGRVPVLVELKTPTGQEGLLEQQVAALLASDEGSAAVLSFNAGALGWMARHAPAVSRGLNCRTVDDLADTGNARADFLSIHKDLAATPAVQSWREDRPAVAWTARSPADAAALAGVVDAVIFEGWRP